MKKITTAIFTLLISINLFAFDWPQSDVTKDSYNSYFGQKRGSLISTSICFSEPAEIKAAENGYILAIIIENSDDTDFFPSTLGTSVILAHDDNLLSVYGNIDKETLTLRDNDEKFIDSGATLGYSGNSGWQVDTSHLEFQIIDTKNKSAINPKVLMPRSETEQPLNLTGIFIENKNHDLYDINVYKTFPAGLYRVYQKRNSIAVPYKTGIYINGVVVDQLSYDIIIQENGKLCINGKKKYTSSDVYPNETLQLLGETMFTPGRVTLGLSENDILNNIKQVNYNILIK